jgi:hypothetical protein
MDNELAGPVSGALDGGLLMTTALGVVGVTGSSVAVDYQGVPGNLPKSYANVVALWHSAIVPWHAEPVRQLTVPEDAESGSVVLDDVTITLSSYTLSYAVGPRLADICASVTFGADGIPGPPASVVMALLTVGTTSLAVRYATLPGYLPATSGNAIALYEGLIDPYLPPPPVARHPISKDVGTGVAGINGVELAIASTYSLTYFTGADASTVAASLTFTTSGG